MKTNDIITRFLEGFTTPEEERQLRATLEAKTTLTADERAALDLLCLSFPVEDTAALLAEDRSSEYNAFLTTRSHRAITPLHYGRLGWAFGIAAAIILAFLLWPKSNEAPIKQKELQPLIAETTQPRTISQEKVEDETTQQQPQTINKGESVSALPEPQIESSNKSQAQAQRLPDEESIDDVDLKAQLYSAEIELERAVHQRQAAYEKEMMQRSLELLIYIMEQEDEEMPTGGVKTQKS